MNLTNEQIQAILDGAPEGAIEHCLYDYGDSTYPLYLNCENQFYEDGKKEWVDMRLVDNYFHSRRRLSDLNEILTLRQEVERLKTQQSEVAARAVESAVKLYSHKWSNDEELNRVGINILRRSDGYIFPEGLLEYAKQLQEGEDDE